MPKKLLMGNEAFAHAALEAGVGVVAGYPGTPSSELIESVARAHAAGKAEGVYVEWSTNEKAALELAYGASLAGARALFTCKQVGLNVASDALMSLNYLGVRGGLVLFVADDPGPISSQTEQDTRRFAQFAKVPVFDPATPEQGAEMMKAAFELSEEFGIPVIVRPTTRINHASTFFEVQSETKVKPPLPGGFVRDPQKWVIFPKLSNEAHGRILKTLTDVARETAYSPQYVRFNPILENMSLEGMPDTPPRVGIVTGGVTTQYAREALELMAREANSRRIPMPRYRLMQVGIPYPFPTRSAKRFLNGLEHVLVLEELDPVIEEELLKVAGDSFLSAHVHGKLTGEAPVKGENSTELMAESIAAFFDSYATRNPRRSAARVGSAEASADAADMAGATRAAGSMKFSDMVSHVVGDASLLHYDGELPQRPPVLCAGCPHRGSFYAVKCALSRIGLHREDAVFCGDIGCYTLGNAKPLDAADTCLCMGAGITMAQGLNVVEPNKKQIAFVGDSTFFASALTGIANAVYNHHDITIAVLDNSTTAMTGSQPHPGTGVTLMDGPAAPGKPIDIEGVLEALGVEFIVNADPLNHEQAEEVSAAALQFRGPSAIIFRSPCVWTVPFGVPAEVDADLCTGCKRCIADIGCPAISFSVDARGPKSGTRGQAVIDSSQCNGCGLCVQVCPFNAIFVPSMIQLAQRESEAEARAIAIAQQAQAQQADLRAVPDSENTAEDMAFAGEASADDLQLLEEKGIGEDMVSADDGSEPVEETEDISQRFSNRDFSAEPLRVYGGSLEIMIETDDPEDGDEAMEGVLL